MKDMVTVGGSIGCAGSGSVTDGSQKVSATVPFDRPAMATMSPACASSIGWRSRPRKARILEMRPVSTSAPSWCSTLTAWFGLTEPDSMRPVMMRPRNGLASRMRADHAERAVVHGRRRHMLQDEVEQRRQALVLRTFRLVGHPAVAARAVEDREIELLVGGVERGEQIEHLVDHLDMAGVGTVDLVDHDDRA